MRPEEDLQVSVINYIKLQYPHYIVNSDMSGVRLTPYQAKKAKEMRTGRSFPDIVIYEARGGYYGLFIELKAEGTVIYKINGELRKDKHLEEQNVMMERLRLRGYLATFSVGFDETKAIIDAYSRLPETTVK